MILLPFFLAHLQNQVRLNSLLFVHHDEHFLPASLLWGLPRAWQALKRTPLLLSKVLAMVLRDSAAVGANHASTPPALTPLSCFWFCLWCCFWFCQCWFVLVEALQQVLQLVLLELLAWMRGAWRGQEG
jgi:hypothetical protein